MVGSLKFLQLGDVSCFCDGGTYLKLKAKMEITLEDVRSIIKLSFYGYIYSIGPKWGYNRPIKNRPTGPMVGHLKINKS